MTSSALVGVTGEIAEPEYRFRRVRTVDWGTPPLLDICERSGDETSASCLWLRTEPISTRVFLSGMDLQRRG